ncbi:hypothetical protein [Kineosporia succinea]|uniref:Uncharacterized protein n=1 Tax=Kineosporia succinea TaxID=84632 RepID=A0ABT9PET3_9ACTN|nr:hypothetical protein [Kineosporia succinea]MDP9831207.1 hypothetical protein [Kineosporia succinea]
MAYLLHRVAYPAGEDADGREPDPEAVMFVLGEVLAFLGQKQPRP